MSNEFNKYVNKLGYGEDVSEETIKEAEEAIKEASNKKALDLSKKISKMANDAEKLSNVADKAGFNKEFAKLMGVADTLDAISNMLKI